MQEWEGLVPLAVFWLMWRRERNRRRQVVRRPGYMPTVRSGYQEPRYSQVRRAYLSVRRVRGMTGGGWLPRRPRL